MKKIKIININRKDINLFFFNKKNKVKKKKKKKKEKRVKRNRENFIQN